MKKIFTLALAAITMAFTTSNTKTLHDFKTKTLDGKDFNLADLKGKKVLIVNTASECGYTPQYKDLEALYEKYKTKKSLSQSTNSSNLISFYFLFFNQFDRFELKRFFITFYT